MATIAVCVAGMPGLARASVATPPTGMFSITPARRYVVATPPVGLTSTRVANGTSETLQVEALPVVLKQTLSGAFDFEASPEVLQSAAALLQTSPSRFVLHPGTVREVSLHWRGLPKGARTANLGVVFEAVPEIKEGPVRVVEQLLNVDLLRRPGRYRVSGRLIGLHVADGEGKTLRFSILAKNTGEVFSSPKRLSLTVYDDAGERLLTQRLHGTIILPGATREYAFDLHLKLPAGSYRAVAAMSFGSSKRSVAKASFMLVAPNELPAASLQVGSLLAHGAVGGHASVDATVRNRGTAAGGLGIELRLYRLSGSASGAVIAKQQLNVKSLRAGEETHLRGALGKLQSGAYRLVATYKAPDGLQQELAADFAATSSLGLLALIARFSREHALLIPIALILLCGVSLLVGVLRTRKLRMALLRERVRVAELMRELARSAAARVPAPQGTPLKAMAELRFVPHRRWWRRATTSRSREKPPPGSAELRFRLSPVPAVAAASRRRRRSRRAGAQRP